MKRTDSSFHIEPLLSSLLQNIENMLARKDVNEIKSLYQDGLHAFLQLKTFNHSFFGFNEEMALQAHHPIQRQDKFIQSDRMRSLLNEKIAEKHFYYSQLAKLRRENNETDGFLTSIAQSADFELQYIDTELSDRIRLEKDLLDLRKKLKTVVAVKEAEEKKLEELKVKLKIFAEYSKPINDYLSLGNILKSSSQLKINSAEPERTAYLCCRLSTPLYVLYKSLQQNIETYNKQHKLSLDIVERHYDNYFEALNISPLSVIFRICTRRRKDFPLITITLKFEYLSSLDVVLVTSYSQRGKGSLSVMSVNSSDVTDFDEQSQKEETDLLNDLIKNDNAERLPTSSKAFSLPNLVPLVYELKGKAFNWVQSLCGFTLLPSPSLSLSERVKYQPFGPIIDYIPVKHLSKEQNPETKVDIVDEAVEIIEMDNVIDQGEFMQDPDFAERQDKDEDEPKPDNFEAEDNEPKNDAIPEGYPLTSLEEIDMMVDDAKITDIMSSSKRRTDLTGDSSIMRMIKDHWWRKNY